MKTMKRSFYEVRTYDGKFRKSFVNYKSARNFCNKLIANEQWCALYAWNADKMEMEEIYAC